MAVTALDGHMRPNVELGHELDGGLAMGGAVGQTARSGHTVVSDVLIASRRGHPSGRYVLVGRQPRARRHPPSSVSRFCAGLVTKRSVSHIGASAPPNRCRTGAIREKRIIAVFGGSTAPKQPVLDFAERMGRLIVADGDIRDILLTGGRTADETSVKGRAIKGAGCATRIGVSPSGPARAVEEDGGIVIYTGLGDQRNYVEASMCDAAIVLDGENGTISEATCALALKRPVAFVGKWQENFNLDPPEDAVLNDMVKITLAKFKVEQADTEFNKKLETSLREQLNQLPALTYLKVNEQAVADVREWMESVVPLGAERAGKLPREVKGMASVEAEYTRLLQAASACRAARANSIAR